MEGSTSGWHLDDLMAYVRKRSQTKRVILLAEGDFGVVGDMLDVKIKPTDNIFLKGYWPLEKTQLEENLPELKTNTVLAVFSHRTEFPTDWPIKIIKEYKKPGNKSSFFLFELIGSTADEK